MDFSCIQDYDCVFSGFSLRAAAQRCSIPRPRNESECRPESAPSNHRTGHQRFAFGSAVGGAALRRFLLALRNRRGVRASRCPTRVAGISARQCMLLRRDFRWRAGCSTVADLLGWKTPALVRRALRWPQRSRHGRLLARCCPYKSVCCSLLFLFHAGTLHRQIFLPRVYFN